MTLMTTETAQGVSPQPALYRCRRCATDLLQAEFYVRKATGKLVNNVCRQCTGLMKAESRARDLERLGAEGVVARNRAIKERRKWAKVYSSPSEAMELLRRNRTE